MHTENTGKYHLKQFHLEQFEQYSDNTNFRY